MTAIGKLLAFLNLAVGIALMTWAVNVYTQRPAWFNPVTEGGVDKGNNPVTFALLKTEIDALTRTAGIASETWGVQLKALEASEKLRADRNKAYELRALWAHKGNPKDLVNAANPKSAKAFYAPVIDPVTKLYDLSVGVTGKPKGAAILGNDGQPLLGLDGLTASIAGDVKEMEDLNKQIIESRREFDKLSAEVVAAEQKALKMAVIRDSVQAELFFLATFEVNVFETRELVIRREKQLRNRLRILGVIDP